MGFLDIILAAMSSVTFTPCGDDVIFTLRWTMEQARLTGTGYACASWPTDGNTPSLGIIMGLDLHVCQYSGSIEETGMPDPGVIPALQSAQIIHG